MSIMNTCLASVTTFGALFCFLKNTKFSTAVPTCTLRSTVATYSTRVAKFSGSTGIPIPTGKFTTRVDLIPGY